MIKVVVVGGGWAGCAAALSAAKAGAQVMLIERTDLLLGTGLVGGIFRNNGRYTAAEEAIAMGGGDLFVAMDANSRHRAVSFPGHSHASFYDVTTMEPLVKKILQNYGVEIKTKTRVVDVIKYGKKLQGIMIDGGDVIKADAFVDTTGTAGPMGNCLTYGNGWKIISEIRIIGEEKRLESYVEIGLFRIIQEALNNVEKHSSATLIKVILEFKAGFVVVLVEDNGVGFNTSEQADNSSFGILGMRERMNLLHGQLAIESEIGKGSKVNIKVPIA
ncbi:FAD-dependent oxidoreductase [bacterium BFN5]|nr:FAD-dependent oxidoreductase [bacterium BFN5]